MPGFWPHHSQPSLAMCQGVCCCLWGCNCGCYLLLCVYTLWVTVPCVSVYVVVILVHQCVVFHCGWLFGHLK